ncbi:MAG: NAD(P)/FAD-dependent oxidoreductase [Bacteroidales bacterium]|nr:NAD(P)/FAD-dependent oxidoreductase [Bacteroidales bacterium]
MNYNLIVIGAGAAGLIAAGRAAENGATILLIEKNNKAGKKLLITGKGRCNITNESSQANYFKNIFPSGRYLKHAFGKFFTAEIIDLLNKLGLKTKTERGNRVFPESEKAADVVNALFKYINDNKVEIKYNCKAEQILVENNKIKGVKINANGKISDILSKNVMICTGGKSYPATGSTGDGYKLAEEVGHTIVPPKPSLVPLVTSGNLAENLQGLSLKNVNASLWLNGKKYKEEFGEMLFAHFGLTGPIILTLSKYAVEELDKKNKIKISIDLKPALNEQKLDARLVRDLNENGKMQIDNIFKMWLPSKMIPVFLDILKIESKKPGHQVTAKERKQILLLMKNFEFEVIDYRGFKEAIITAGGISTAEVDGKTMQSKIIENLYFAGEVLDLDANTGGYNLQIAYSTAWLAAEALTSVKI